ncbi:DUF6022 family protein [Dyadobacter crusticola]|uniref:DUF6022 family protein n=1 Tax=Dyadobacter crusticola TaxID=292407 RepID=UPI00054D32E4|nr:DUF6022 family protein [Dyadobacter crusticola]
MQSITVKSNIREIAEQIRLHINNNWKTVLEKHSDRLLRAYEQMGDGAYGLYLDLLFKPVYRQLKDSGFKVMPKLPGNLNISREWGNVDETDQERWMWSVIKFPDKSDCGTIVVEVFHDHTQFRLPKPPAIRFMHLTKKEDIIAELSRISPDFSKAKDMVAEYADYLAKLSEEMPNGDN